jgi:hypothetical protein
MRGRINHPAHIENSPWREDNEADAGVSGGAGLNAEFGLTAKVAKDTKNSNYKIPNFIFAPLALFAVQIEF